MDRIRELAGVPDLPIGIVAVDGGWEASWPGLFCEFRIVPHGRLLCRVSPSKRFVQHAWVRNEREALIYIEHFARGVAP